MTIPTMHFAHENAARQALLETACALELRGLSHGSSGNVSLRWDRSGARGLLITPSAMPFGQCSIDDLVWMGLSSGLAESRPVLLDGVRRPSSEWRFHHDLYAGREELQAIVHAHAPQAALLSCLPRVQQEGIPAFHYMIALAGGADIRCAPYATFGTSALSVAVVQALQGRKACLMAHHGLIAAGTSLAAALALAEEVEWLSAAYARALALGGPALLDAAEMARVLERFADYKP
jgi:L-fuculose-phosphate aldolase